MGRGALGREWGLFLFLCLFVRSCVRGQDETTKPEVYSLHIQSDIKFRFATTLISSRMANPENVSREAVFSVTLPDDAFISNFTLEVDGEVYTASIDEKGKAKAKFEQAKKKGQSAGHVSKTPRDTNRFKVQVNVAGLSKVQFNLTYQELLRRSRGVYQHKVYVDPGQPVDDLQIEVAILESRPITTLHVPPIRTDLLTNLAETELNEVAVIVQPTPTTAHIVYIPDVEKQLEYSEFGIKGQFVVQYDIEREMDTGDLMVVNGYFVHFFAPEVPKPIPKDVLFVLDTSGSMASTKIQQLKEAMYIIMDDLIEGDRFNIMRFSGSSSLYQDGMVDASARSVLEAKQYVKGLTASGWTNINSALLKTLERLQTSQIEGERSPIVVFLTDGEATSGVEDNSQILENVKKANDISIPVFSLAFGEDADWDLVKKVALQNNGVAKKIYEDSDAALQIAGFYDEMAVTLLNNVSIKYLGESVSEESVTQSHFSNYFRGSEMVVAGRLEDADADAVQIKVLGSAVDGDLLLEAASGFDFSTVGELTKEADFPGIVEKTWAYLTIKQLLERSAGELNATAAEIMKERALALSLEHSFVTPLTSLVVTKPEEEAPDLLSGRDPSVTPPPVTTTTRSYYRRGGGGGGGYGGGGGGDPHYMIRQRGIDHPICFDVISTGNEIYRLLQDPSRGITINAGIVQSLRLNEKGEPKSFIGQMTVLMKHHKLAVTPEHIFFDGNKTSWTSEYVQHFDHHKMLITAHGHRLTIRFSFGPQVVIKRHVKAQSDEDGVSFLNMYIVKEDGFSKRSSGLLGHFVNGHVHMHMKKTWRTEKKQMAKFQIIDRSHLGQAPAANTTLATETIRHVVRANLVEKSEVIEKGTEFCWRVHHKFDSNLFGYLPDLRIDNLFQV